jgi:prefoldin beta subunit
MNEEEQRTLVMDFERNRQLLGTISSQKQQLSVQNEVIMASLEELKGTKEKSVLKVVGNILVQKSVTDMKKELEEQKETTGLKLKTLEKQEENIIKKLNSIKAKVEGAQDGAKEKETKKKSKK